MAVDKAWNKDWQQVRRPSETQSGRMRLDRQQNIEKGRVEARQRITQKVKSQMLQQLKLNTAKKTRVLDSLRSYKPTDTGRARDTGLRQQAVNSGSENAFQRQFQKTREAARGLNDLAKKPQGNKTADKAAVITKNDAGNQPQFSLSQTMGRVPHRQDLKQPAPKVPSKTAKKTDKPGVAKDKLADKAKDSKQPAQLAKGKGRTAKFALPVAKSDPGLHEGSKSDKKGEKKSSLKTNEGGAKSKALGQVLDGQGGRMDTGADLNGGGSDGDVPRAVDNERTPLTETDPGRKAYCDATPQQEQVIAYFSIWKSQVLKNRLAEIAAFNSELDQSLAKIIVQSDNPDAVGQVMRGARLPKNSDGGFRA